jgi:hypothetical protein
MTTPRGLSNSSSNVNQDKQPIRALW